MKRSSIFLSAAFLLTAWMPAHAGTAWISDADIESIHVVESGTFFVTLVGNDLPGCSEGELMGRVESVVKKKNGKKKTTKGMKDNGWKAALSMLLSAASLGKSVDILYDDGSAECLLLEVVIVY